jgi:hypothetical protein
MALFFILNDGHELTWHVNYSLNGNAEKWALEKRPEIWQKIEPENAPYASPKRYVVGVMADGHELEYLLRIFKGLPVMSACHPRYGRGVTWRGDLAQFIYDNLP